MSKQLKIINKIFKEEFKDEPAEDKGKAYYWFLKGWMANEFEEELE